uniref:Uncharacterized protein n=1 Tax=Rhizophora mucronata TaxID=61149 RepID=A0A2P2P6I5_RHIMU
MQFLTSKTVVTITCCLFYHISVLPKLANLSFNLLCISYDTISESILTCKTSYGKCAHYHQRMPNAIHDCM